MTMNEDDIFEQQAEYYFRCERNTLLPYALDWTCIACGYNVEKMNLQ